MRRVIILFTLFKNYMEVIISHTLFELFLKFSAKVLSGSMKFKLFDLVLISL